MEHLLNAKALPGVCDLRRDTPLHLASRKGHIECTRLLVNAGADVELVNFRCVLSLCAAATVSCVDNCVLEVLNVSEPFACMLRPCFATETRAPWSSHTTTSKRTYSTFCRCTAREAGGGASGVVAACLTPSPAFRHSRCTCRVGQGREAELEEQRELVRQAAQEEENARQAVLDEARQEAEAAAQRRRQQQLLQAAMEKRRKAAEEERARQQAIVAKEKAEAEAARAKARDAHMEATRVAKQQARERRIAQRKLDAARREAQRLEWEAALKADKLVRTPAHAARQQGGGRWTCTASHAKWWTLQSRPSPRLINPCAWVCALNRPTAAHEQVQGESEPLKEGGWMEARCGRTASSCYILAPVCGDPARTPVRARCVGTVP